MRRKPFLGPGPRSHKRNAEACIRNFDPKHQYEKLRSVATRCEQGVNSYDLLHDIWKVMSALQDCFSECRKAATETSAAEEKTDG